MPRTMQPINDTVRLAIFIKLPIDIQELFLEAAYIFKYTGVQYKSTKNQQKQLLNKWLLNIMRYYLFDVKDRKSVV